jgi:hypothetical protein
MRKGKQTTPLFIVCKRTECRQLREVNRPYLQRRGGYCSRRCAAIVNQNISNAECGKGGLESGRRRQAAVVARVAGLSPIDAFRLGYVRGLQSKLRQIGKRYVLVRKDGAPA